jgi:hypothetical protein
VPIRVRRPYISESRSRTMSRCRPRANAAHVAAICGILADQVTRRCIFDIGRSPAGSRTAAISAGWKLSSAAPRLATSFCPEATSMRDPLARDGSLGE